MVSIYRSLLHERFKGDITFRSSCSEMFYQNDPNKNFRKEKIFLNKIEDYRLTAISEKRLAQVVSCKVSENIFFKENLRITGFAHYQFSSRD